MIVCYVTNERMTDTFTVVSESVTANANDLVKYAENTIEVSYLL